MSHFMFEPCEQHSFLKLCRSYWLFSLWIKLSIIFAINCCLLVFGHSVDQTCRSVFVKIFTSEKLIRRDFLLLWNYSSSFNSWHLIDLLSQIFICCTLNNCVYWKCEQCAPISCRYIGLQLLIDFIYND